MEIKTPALLPRSGSIPRAPIGLSGVPVEGEKLVRTVYLDESGISINEPYLVVAGVAVDTDRQHHEISDHIRGLIEKYVPPSYRDGFTFHAKDLFHGAGPLFNRQHCPASVADEALMALLTVPGTFHLPVAYGYVKKPLFKCDTKRERRETARMNHALGFSLCAIAVDSFMRNNTESERAHLIAENNGDTRETVKRVHGILEGRDQSDDAKEILESLRDVAPDFYPIRRIVDMVYFAEKSDAFLLQLADACAFIIRCFIEGKPRALPFVNALTADNPSVLSTNGKIASCDVISFISV